MKSKYLPNDVTEEVFAQGLCTIGMGVRAEPTAADVVSTGAHFQIPQGPMAGDGGKHLPKGVREEVFPTGLPTFGIGVRRAATCTL